MSNASFWDTVSRSVQFLAAQYRRDLVQWTQFAIAATGAFERGDTAAAVTCVRRGIGRLLAEKELTKLDAVFVFLSRPGYSRIPFELCMEMLDQTKYFKAELPGRQHFIDQLMDRAEFRADAKRMVQMQRVL